MHYKCKVFTSLNLCASCVLVQLFATVHLVLHYTKEFIHIRTKTTMQLIKNSEYEYRLDKTFQQVCEINVYKC